MRYKEINTVSRALRAIECLAEKPMSISELSRELGVDRGTVSRLLATLEKAGYIQRADGGGKCRISEAKVVALYGLVESRIELAQLARPILARLRDDTYETAVLAVLAEDEMVCVAAERSRAAISATAVLGRSSPIHSSAVGKALAASLADRRLNEVLSRKGLPPFTPRTITSPEVLRAQLARIGTLGYAVDDEETEFGMRCIASPVRNYSGKTVASIGISGPSNRITLQRTHEFADIVMAAARDLSSALGWESPENRALQAAGSLRHKDSP